MCTSCGCGRPMDPHGDDRNITLPDLEGAAAAAGITVGQAVANMGGIVAAIRKALTEQPGRELPDGVRREVVRQMDPLVKGGEEKRFLLGLAYQAGQDPRIKRGADGGRDWMTPETLEKACWSFLPGGGQIGIAHLDGTLGHMTVTENYIYRGPDWPQANGTVIKSGEAWLIGGICDEYAWDLAKSGKLNGFSPQGSAMRRTVKR